MNPFSKALSQPGDVDNVQGTAAASMPVLVPLESFR